MPQLMAEANNEVYVKKNEDFMTILSGALGKRKESYSRRQSFRY
jgi:hypothetical protein